MNRLDHIFKEKLEGLQSPPHPNLWAELEAQLDQRRRKALIWPWLAAASVALLLLATGALWWLRGSGSTAEQQALISPSQLGTEAEETCLPEKPEPIRMAPSQPTVTAPTTRQTPPKRSEHNSQKPIEALTQLPEPKSDPEPTTPEQVVLEPTAPQPALAETQRPAVVVTYLPAQKPPQPKAEPDKN